MIRLPSAIAKHKAAIDKRLVDYLTQKKRELAKVNTWGADACDRLMPFITSGKTVRGSLVVFSYLIFKKTVTPPVLGAAAAIELLHSGLLIHDDIMDQDTKRRGNAAIHSQYQKLSDIHAGESMGISVGDLAFFLAFELLAPHVVPLVSSELARVSVAQMQDVVPVGSSEDDIMRLYKYKTARYTLSMPLAVGAHLAKSPQKTFEKLETLGEHMGILYQIRDDELDKTAQVVPADRLKQLKEKHITQSNILIASLPISANAKADLFALSNFCGIRKK